MNDPEPSPLHPEEMDEETQKKLAVGQCNYLLLLFLSTAASIMSSNATWYCNFAHRNIEWASGWDVDKACAKVNMTGTSYTLSSCESFLDADVGVGFYSWMATIPVNQQVCLSYTLFVPNVGYVTPSFDGAFNAGKVFAVLANISGTLGWFSVVFASCCPVDQARVAGLAGYFTMAFVFQCFSFLLYASNVCKEGFLAQYLPMLQPSDWEQMVTGVSCSLGAGAKISITATVLYVICSALAPVSIAPKPMGYSRNAPPPPQHEYNDEPQQQTTA